MTFSQCLCAAVALTLAGIVGIGTAGTPSAAAAPAPAAFVTDDSAGTLTAPAFRFRFGTPAAPLFKPYVDIFATPAGRNVLQDAPRDHIHHHGLMFAIKINNVNFWEERPIRTAGKQLLLRDTLRAAAGKVSAELEWRASAGKLLAREKRSIALRTDIIPAAEATLLDWSSQFFPAPDASVANPTVLGGNFYHGLGLRFAQSLTRAHASFFAPDDAGTPEPGLYDKKHEKLTPTRWLAMCGNINGERVTVAVFDSPSNHRKMLTYSCDNRHMTYLSATANLWRQPISLAPGKTATFRYAVCAWDGEPTIERIENAYKRWIEAVK